MGRVLTREGLYVAPALATATMMALLVLSSIIVLGECSSSLPQSTGRSKKIYLPLVKDRRGPQMAARASPSAQESLPRRSVRSLSTPSLRKIKSTRHNTSPQAPYATSAASQLVGALRTSPAGPSPRGISNTRGGPVMYSPIGLYIYWVGTFTQAQKDLTRELVASFSPSTVPTNTADNWWEINAKYYDPQGRTVSRQVTILGEVQSGPLDQVPQLTYNPKGYYFLADAFSLVTSLLDQNVWPADPNAIYVAFTDEHIVEGDFCNGYCAWHWYTPWSNSTFKGNLVFFWAGIPGQQIPGCYEGCTDSAIWNGTYTPYTGEGTIHGGLDSFAHELAEAASDPFGTTWADRQGAENADKCAFQYGKTYTAVAPSGPPYIYNMVGVNGGLFYIQMNWDLISGTCLNGMTTPQLPPPSPPPSPPPPPATLLVAPCTTSGTSGNVQWKCTVQNQFSYTVYKVILTCTNVTPGSGRTQNWTPRSCSLSSTTVTGKASVVLSWYQQANTQPQVAIASYSLTRN